MTDSRSGARVVFWAEHKAVVSSKPDMIRANAIFATVPRTNPIAAKSPTFAP